MFWSIPSSFFTFLFFYFLLFILATPFYFLEPFDLLARIFFLRGYALQTDLDGDSLIK